VSCAEKNISVTIWLFCAISRVFSYLQWPSLARISPLREPSNPRFPAIYQRVRTTDRTWYGSVGGPVFWIRKPGAMGVVPGQLQRRLDSLSKKDGPATQLTAIETASVCETLLETVKSPEIPDETVCQANHCLCTYTETRFIAQKALLQS